MPSVRTGKGLRPFRETKRQLSARRLGLQYVVFRLTGSTRLRTFTNATSLMDTQIYQTTAPRPCCRVHRKAWPALGLHSCPYEGRPRCRSGSNQTSRGSTMKQSPRDHWTSILRRCGRHSNKARNGGNAGQFRRGSKVSLVQYALLCFILSLAAANAAGPFDGTYRPNYDFAVSWNCTDIGTDGGALAIRDHELFGVESYCRLTEPVRVNGMHAILYNGICAAEGYEYSERIMLMKSDHGVYVIRDGFALDLIHCN